MKKLVVSIFVVFLLSPAQSQNADNTLLPIDPKIRTGVLPNGIRYYVRKNSKPEKRAELRLAVNVGSTAENDDQQGLAHFVEHMAFNGTEHFKKNDLINFLESVGTKFGAHLNAYTSFDETVYMLQVPTDVDTILDKAILVLEDWAHNLSFDPAEIDKERGVVVEEWRLGQGAQERMRRKYWPILFKDSRYAERLPIGKKEILEKCKHETLKQFYEDWYRPDLMAIIAVGDFDVDKMVLKITKEFSLIPQHTSPRPIKSWNVPDQKEFVSVVCSDKENPYTMIQISYKQESKSLATHTDYRSKIIQGLYNGMINQRLAELQQQSNPPFMYAYTGYSSFVRTKDVYTSFAVVKEDEIERGVATLITENERIKRFGFTETELERQKKDYYRTIEKAYNERDKSESNGFAKEYVSNFLNKEGIPGLEYEYMLTQKYLQGITIGEVNSLAKEWISEGTNCSAVIMTPEKDGFVLPKEEAIKKAFEIAQHSDIKPYVDKVIDKPLIEAKLVAGVVVDRKTFEKTGVTEWKLSNGMKVILKPTDFKNDEILFTSSKMGGTSLAKDDDFISADLSNAIVEESGIGGFDKTSLTKFLQGKVVNLYTYIVDINQGFKGSCAPQDLETTLQLLHLYHTSPRKDEEAFQSLIEQRKGILQNRQASPGAVFGDTIGYYLGGYHYRHRPMTTKIVEEANLDKALAFYTERFNSGNGWVYTFVGNFKVEEIEPLILQYLGSIPNNGKNENYRNLNIKSPQGTAEKIIRKGVDPKATVRLMWSGSFDYTRKSRFEASALLKLLSIKLRENLREEKGGVYGVGAYPKFEHYPESKFEVIIGFGCGPENVDELIKASLSEIEDVRQNGCSAINLTKIKETFLRERETNLKENTFWLSAISQNDINNESLDELFEYDQWVKNLNSEDFKLWADQYIDMKEFKKFLLLPEKE